MRPRTSAAPLDSLIAATEDRSQLEDGGVSGDNDWAAVPGTLGGVVLVLVGAVGVGDSGEHQGEVVAVQSRDRVGEVDGDAEVGEAGGDAEYPVVAAAAPGQCSRVEGGGSISPPHPRVPRLLGFILIGEFDERRARSMRRFSPAALVPNRSSPSRPPCPHHLKAWESGLSRSLVS